MSTTLLPPLGARHALPTNTMPTTLAVLDESRAGVAKAWIVRAIEAAPLEQIELLPVGRIASELPALVADLVRAADGARPSAAERAAWLDRLASLRGDSAAAPGPLARDLGALHEALLGSLEPQAAGLEGADVIRTAAQLAALFADLHADAAERTTSAGATLDGLLSGADRLTGLHGQDFLRAHLRHLVSMQKRYDQPFALLVVDVDGLKRINQAWGERAGDETLIGVAGAVERSVRTADTAVRMEEDEFCVLLPNQTAGRARTVAERLAEAVEQVRDPSGGGLKIAIGVVACPQHGTTADELLELADSALFRAKAAGLRVALGAEALEE